MAQLTTKNLKTGQPETIPQHDLTRLDWGFHFFVDGELDAFKAAYLYRNSPHGLKVEYAGGAQRWMVTVFNERAAGMGLDGARGAQGG